MAATRSGRIGLLATPTTVASGAYEEAVGGRRPVCDRPRVACPTLAAIIQAGEQFDERAVETVREVCEPLRRAQVDTVILGCTHYPLIPPLLQRMLGRRVKLVSSGAGAGAPGGARAEHARAAQRARRRGRLPLPLHRRREVFRASGRAFCRCHSARSSALSWLVERDGVSGASRSYGRGPGESAPDRDRAGVHAHGDRLCADLGRGDARDLHRLRAGKRPPLDGGQGPGWADGRVRDAARVDRRSQAARRDEGRPTAARSRSSV